MTDDAEFKALVRRIAAETGQRYTTVRESLRHPNGGPMLRRAFGLRTTYGLAFEPRRPEGKMPEDIGAYLFRRVVAWGRSSNVFLENGSRLYLTDDAVGGQPQPAYATPEC